MNLSLSKMRLSVLALGIAATLSLAACGSSTPATGASNPLGLLTPGTITAATGTDQPPFVTAGADGRPEGFIIDVTNEVAKRLGVTVQYKSTTVPASLAGLTSGQYDLAASGLGITDERLKSVAFSKGLFWSETAVVTAKSATQKSLTGFSGKKVGVVTGSVQEAFITAKMPGAVTTKFQGAAPGLSQLLSGSIDAFVLGGPDAQEYLKQYDSLKIAVAAPVTHATAVAMPKGNKALVSAWDAQVAAMVKDGTFGKIYARWFPKEPPRPELIAIWPGLKAGS